MKGDEHPGHSVRDDSKLRDRILDTAVELAEKSDWEAVRLHEVAASLGIGLDQIQRYFREKDELIDAWFDRADAAALAATHTTGFEELTHLQRMETTMLAWLDHLAPHRKVVRQMIGAKLEFGHIHLQIPALMRISRTVQWFREAAGFRDELPRRAVIEALHTTIYLATFVYWMRDESVGSTDTRQFLHRRLEQSAII